MSSDVVAPRHPASLFFSSRRLHLEFKAGFIHDIAAQKQERVTPTQGGIIPLSGSGCDQGPPLPLPPSSAALVLTESVPQAVHRIGSGFCSCPTGGGGCDCAIRSAASAALGRALGFGLLHPSKLTYLVRCRGVGCICNLPGGINSQVLGRQTLRCMSYCFIPSEGEHPLLVSAPCHTALQCCADD